MKSKNKKGSFFTLLLGNYITFTFVLVIVLSTLFVIGMFITAEKVMEADPKQILEYGKTLAKGNYSSLPLEKMLGEKGYIFVLDEKYNVIYKSNPKVNAPDFDKDEIKYIPFYTIGFNMYKENFTNDKNEKCTSILVNYLDDDGEIIPKLYVVDENFNILYQSEENGKTHLTNREYKLLTNTLYKDYNLAKHKFYDESGNLYTMLIYQPREREDLLNSKVGLIIKSVFSSFFIFYCILIGVFIIWLNRKVKKPLNMLHEAMEKFSHGQREVYISYKGPREFVEICDSFNQMSKELYESEENRKQLEMDKQKMLADISHDLKTPITVIQGYAKGIYDGIVSKEEQPQYLETIYKKADGLAELINTFYQYSKMEHPNYNLELKEKDICIFLRNYMADKYNEIDLQGYELEVDIPEERIICNIDQVELSRAFENIINNSIKHNESGTIISCSLSRQEDYVKIILADNGCGIPEAIKKDIFDPFVVGEKSRSKQGSGLGLAVSKKIINAHKGTISLIEPPRNHYKVEFEILIPIVKA